MNQNELKKAIAKLLWEMCAILIPSARPTMSSGLGYQRRKRSVAGDRDEQTAGRGRLDRKMVYAQGDGACFSLILVRRWRKNRISRGPWAWPRLPWRFLRRRGLVAQIKWPNDVLLNGCRWQASWSNPYGRGRSGLSGDRIGVNVRKEAVPLPNCCNSLPPAWKPRWDPLWNLTKFCTIFWRDDRPAPTARFEFIHRFVGKSACIRGEQVQVEEGSGNTITGKLLGLEPDGSLQLSNEGGKSSQSALAMCACAHRRDILPCAMR